MFFQGLVAAAERVAFEYDSWNTRRTNFMKTFYKNLATAFFSFSVIALANPAVACTAFQLQARDGSWVYFRSMEFGLPFNSEMLIVPRGTQFSGTAGGGAPGLQWTAKYGVVGPNQDVMPNM